MSSLSLQVLVFFRLPPEILTLIVKQCVEMHANLWNGETSALRTLRRVHPRFAFLSSLCKRLFYYVVLEPDPDREQLRDWSFIGPFVREVYLEPLLRTEPDLPWLDQEARDDARRALKPYQRYIDCGRAASNLVRVLKNLTNVQRICIMANAKDTQVTFPVANQFITFATQCLYSAGLELEELELRNVGIRELWSMDHLVSWISSPVYVELQLSNLKHLKVELQNSSIPENSEVALGKIARALCKILENCKESLETLSIATHTAVLWHQPAVAPRMARLKCLQLDDCKVEITSFAEWLLTCEVLARVTLTGIGLLGPNLHCGLVAWKPVFDAIRQHPRRILFEVDELETVFDHRSYLGENGEPVELTVSLSHDPSEPILAGEEIDDHHSEWPGVKAMLKGYMSDTQDWDLAPGW